MKGVFKSLKPPLTLNTRCRPFISLKVDLNGEHNLNYMTSDNWLVHCHKLLLFCELVGTQ
jgi:hypothetical protein